MAQHAYSRIQSWQEAFQHFFGKPDDAVPVRQEVRNGGAWSISDQTPRPFDMYLYLENVTNVGGRPQYCDVIGKGSHPPPTLLFHGGSSGAWAGARSFGWVTGDSPFALGTSMRLRAFNYSSSSPASGREDEKMLCSIYDVPGRGILYKAECWNNDVPGTGSDKVVGLVLIWR